MKATFSLMMLLVVTYVGQGATDTFIAANTKWKFFDQGMDQGTAWRANAFNDVAWVVQNTELGFGDGDEAYTINGGPPASRFTTTYFRKAFNVVNPANYSSITFDLLVDDGAVVYLNGIEVYRQNMPAGTILYSTFASAAAGDPGVPAENAWTTIPSSPALLSALQTGINVIAVEVHQNSLTSSDLSFNFRFFGQTTLTSYIEANNVAWKYWDNAAAPANWQTTGFVDASWASGNAELGYGDNDEETVVSYGGVANINNKYTTTYFRKAFTVASIPSALSLDLLCDDGAVVYLNGVEIYRQNMPAGTILYSTFASAAAGDPGVPTETAWTPATLNPASLIVGTNVIAVEIHQNSLTSSDISFNLRLTNNTSNPMPAITRGAYLQMLSPNSITIRWQTDIASNSKVDFGTTMAYGTSTNNATVSTEHEVQLTGLTANTKYFYQIGTSTIAIQGTSYNFFKTGVSPGSSNFKVWVTGDMGVGTTQGHNDQIAVANAYQTHVGATPADFWIWLGDNAYSSGTALEYTQNVFNVHTDLLKSLPVFPSLGNHDYGNQPYLSASTLTTNWEYFSAFTLPTNAELGGVASNTEKYYSYNYGNAHFVVIDSWGAPSTVGGTMYNWLQSDLLANTKKFVVCYFHNPPYTKGTHDSDDSVFDLPSFDIRQNLMTLMENNNVDLVLSGHSHVYERSPLLRGHTGVSNTFNATTMVLNGTSGNVVPYYKKYATGGVGTVYAVCGNSGQGGVVHSYTPWPHPAMTAKSLESTRGSMILEFTANDLTAKFLDINGIVQDNFKIVKEDCPTVGGIQSQLSGNWTNTLTWGCGVVPTATTNATINQGHTVTINGITPEVKTLTEKGTLQFMLGGKIKVNN
jgi:hypothetical protein